MIWIIECECFCILKYRGRFFERNTVLPSIDLSFYRVPFIRHAITIAWLDALRLFGGTSIAFLFSWPNSFCF